MRISEQTSQHWIDQGDTSTTHHVTFHDCRQADYVKKKKLSLDSGVEVEDCKDPGLCQEGTYKKTTGIPGDCHVQQSCPLRPGVNAQCIGSAKKHSSISLRALGRRAHGEERSKLQDVAYDYHSTVTRRLKGYNDLRKEAAAPILGANLRIRSRALCV